MIITTKIGRAFAPNIENSVIDRSKRRWKYIGDAGKSIIAKENDQENIITLNYEPDRVKVFVQYLNDIGQKIKSDLNIIKGNFITNVLRKSLPGGLTVVINIIIVIICAYKRLKANKTAIIRLFHSLN